MNLSTNSSGVLEQAVGKDLRDKEDYAVFYDVSPDMLSTLGSENDAFFPSAPIVSLFWREELRYNLLVIEEGDPSLDRVIVSTLGREALE